MTTYCGCWVLYASPCTLMLKPRRRIFFALAVVVGAVVIGVFSLRYEFQRTHAQDRLTVAATAILADDISRLNATAIHEIWDVPGDEGSAQSALRELLKQVGSAGMHISLAGARHSMGGQTIAPGGVSVNMLPLKSMSLDESTDLL